MKSLFTLDGGIYLPTPWAVGPWDPNLIHGSSTAALFAYGFEAQLPGAEWLLARLSIDIFRPVAVAPTSLRGEVVREGKRIKLADLFIEQGGVVVARAKGLMLLPGEDAAAPAPGGNPVGSWRDYPTAPDVAVGDRPQFNVDVEFRPTRPAASGPGFAVWIRVPYAILPDTPMSPTVRAAAVADITNAVGIWSLPDLRGFINADIDLTLHRRPQGEWICLESTGRPDARGIAVSSVNVHDEAGLLGGASTVCLAKPMQLFGKGVVPGA